MPRPSDPAAREVRGAAHVRPSPTDGVLLGLRDVTFSYGRDPVLRGATLAVREGETVALLGPSGAGKSTLLACMAGLRRPTGGVVELWGEDLARAGRDRLAELRLRTFGFVLQDGGLLDELSLRENVELPLRLAGVPAREAAGRAGGVLDALGIDAETGGRRPAEVSGGQQQRAAVARAVVHGPAVVFADEPTGALDETSSSTVVDLLVRATSRAGCALVMVTHNPALAARMDRRLHVHDGHVVEDAA